MSDQYYESKPTTAPFSQEAEEATLGACLTNPNVYFAIVGLLESTDFFLLRHQWIWEAIKRIVARGDDYDYLTVAEELRSAGHLEQVGGIAYLLQLVNNTPSSSMGQTYAKLVARAATRRRLLVAADEIRELALNEEINLEMVTEQSERSMLAAIGQTDAAHTVTFKSAVHEILDHVEGVIMGEKEFAGLPTGFRDIDNLLKGLKRGSLTYVAARPGMGKSAFLLNVAVHLAKLGVRVLFWSGEMGAMENASRVISAEIGISSARLMEGKLDARGYERLVEAAGRVAELPLYIDTTAAITPQQLRSLITKHKIQHGIDLLICDYVQLMKVPGQTNRVQEVSEISMTLKEMAMRFNFPVMAAAQLSRACEQRQDKRPVLSDLRDSGQLEQDADVVMFIYRDEVYNDMTERPNEADIIVAKHRQGPTDTLTLYFDKTVTRFVNGNAQPVNLKGTRS